MNIKNELKKFGLYPDNSVVIGSGILSALGIRESKDIDVVVDENTYLRLSFDSRFRKAENHGREVLVDDLFEIGTSLDVLGKNWKLNDFLNKSVVINDVRYITIQFFLDIKKNWLADKNVRQKDIDDVKLIEDYLRKEPQ